MSPYISAFENLPNDEDRPATLAYSERAWGLAPRPNIGPCQRCSGIHPVPSTSIASSHLPVSSQHPLFSKSDDILKSTAADLHHSRYITVYVQILPSFVLFANNCFKIKSKCILLHDGKQGSYSFWHISNIGYLCLLPALHQTEPTTRSTITINAFFSKLLKIVILMFCLTF